MTIAAYLWTSWGILSFFTCLVSISNPSDSNNSLKLPKVSISVFWIERITFFNYMVLQTLIISTLVTQFTVSKTIYSMIIDHTDSLHHWITYLGAYKLESSFSEVSTNKIGLLCHGRNFFIASPGVLYGFVVYKIPYIGIKTAKLFLDFKECISIDNCCFNLFLISDYGWVRTDRPWVLVGYARPAVNWLVHFPWAKAPRTRGG